MAPQVRLLVPLLLLLAGSGCVPLLASGLGGSGGYDLEAVEALKKDCDMKTGELAVGKYVRVECYDPERWR